MRVIYHTTKYWVSLSFDSFTKKYPKPFNECDFVIINTTRCKYFDPCYARATVVRAHFLAAAFSDGSYLAHVNGAYLRHVTFCIVRGPPLFIVSPISQRGPASVRGPLPLTVPGWSKVHDGDFEGVKLNSPNSP